MSFRKTITHLTIIKKSNKVIEKEIKSKKIESKGYISLYNIEESVKVERLLENGNDNRRVKDIVADYANYLTKTYLELSPKEIRKMSLDFAKDFVKLRVAEVCQKSTAFLEEFLANPESYYILSVTEITRNADTKGFELAFQKLNEEFPFAYYLDYNFVTGEQIVHVPNKDELKLDKKAKKLKEDLAKSLGENFKQLMLLIEVDTSFSKAKKALGLTISKEEYELLKLA